MIATSTTLDPIRADQQLFRATLTALSTPGIVYQLPAAPLSGIDTIRGNRWAISLLVALLDHEVSLAVEQLPAADELVEIVRKRTRTTIAGRERADFVIADLTTLNPAVPLAIKRGSLQYPDDGATLIIQVPSLDTDSVSALSLRLTGPGINGERKLHLPGFPEAFFVARDEAVSHYPMGIDILLIDSGGRLLGLPRTTTIEVHAEVGI